MANKTPSKVGTKKRPGPRAKQAPTKARKPRANSTASSKPASEPSKQAAASKDSMLTNLAKSPTLRSILAAGLISAAGALLFRGRQTSQSRDTGRDDEETNSREQRSTEEQGLQNEALGTQSAGTAKVTKRRGRKPKAATPPGIEAPPTAVRKRRGPGRKSAKFPANAGAKGAQPSVAPPSNTETSSIAIAAPSAVPPASIVSDE